MTSNQLPLNVKPASYFQLKPQFSYVLGGLLFLISLPLLFALIVIIRCTSRGPAIYRQRRVGKNGAEFTMFKLRSMSIDAEHNSGPVWSQPSDPRVNFVGRILRKLHLDEIPQLWNVMRGEMDLFGPRPERPEITVILDREIDGYDQRHLVLPGITGLAQINLPPDTDIDSVRKKVLLDLEYISDATFWLDCRMFFATLLRLLGVPGETVMDLLQVRRVFTDAPINSPNNVDIVHVSQIEQSRDGDGDGDGVRVTISQAG